MKVTILALFLFAVLLNTLWMLYDFTSQIFNAKTVVETYCEEEEYYFYNILLFKKVTKHN